MKPKRDRMERVDFTLMKIAQKRKEKTGISKTQTYREMAHYINATMPDFSSREVIIPKVDASKTKRKKKGEMDDYFKI